MDLHLQDQVALVTGAGSGFGSAIASALVDEGCIAYLGDLDLPAADRAAGRLGARARGLRIDVANPADVRAQVQRILDEAGRIDILVNNAGILKTGSIVDATMEDWDEVCRVNLSGVYYCSKAVLPAMLERKSGSIINIASVSAYKGGGVFGNTLYGATKAGVIALTKGFARELAPSGIRVNAIAPGLADTGMTARHLTQEKRSAVAGMIPFGRLASTSDIARVVAFLASRASEYIVGETVAVDGGYLTR